MELYGNNLSLIGIVIPNTVKTIGKGVFWYCSSLTSITIPSSVTSIGEYAFRDCSSLATVNFEQGFAGNIVSNAFRATPWISSQPDASAVVINGTSYNLSGT